MKRPLIGVTPDIHALDSGATDFALREAYADALLTLGAIPILLFPTEADGLSEPLPLLDGLLFTGGADVDPATYGAERSPYAARPSPAGTPLNGSFSPAFFPRGSPSSAFAAECRS